MEIQFATAALPETGTLVVPAGADGLLGRSAAELDRRTGGALRHALELAGGRFKRGAVLELLRPAHTGLDRVLILGVGKPHEAKRFDLEGLGGSLVVKLRELNVARAAVAVDELQGLAATPAELAVALGAGARLRGYRFTKYRTKPQDDETTEVEAITLHLDAPGEAEAGFADARAVIEGVVHGRDLVTEPANVLSPKAFADACRALGEEVGLDVQILAPSALQELGMNALLAVGQGSANEPYVAVMRWAGGPEGEAPIGLVGKGVCFDSGGLSLKPANSMQEMKWDMAGAAAVFGTMKALALRRARVNVAGVLGLVENMPSATAQRPGDVIKTMAGITVEVLNTDAEGRLVLADVLHYTADRFKPKIMVDLATLTGGVITALGHEQAGLFSDDDEIVAKLQAAGAAVGEKLWRLPLGDEYAEHIKSEIADVKNIGRAPEAAATAGAMFLKRFAGDVPWAHIDIAGTAWSKRDLALVPKGATGFGIRLLDRWIADNYET